MRLYYTFLLVILLSAEMVQAQTINLVTETVNQNDTVVIRLNDYTGTVQWQISLDSVNWTDITNANDDTLMIIADVTSYIRASVIAGICDPFISDIAKIIVNISYESAISEVYEIGRFVYGDLDLCIYKLCISDLIKKGSHITDQSALNQYAGLEGFDASNTAVKTLWDNYYEGLSIANTIIERINNEDPAEKSQLSEILGEAYYFRAYFHKSLVERWDNIVLSDNTNPDISIATKEDVYNLIVSDLDAAITLLPEASDVETVTGVSKGVARHLLSLVHMDLENWTEAAAYATEVINDPAYALLSYNDIEDVFSVQTQENSEIIFSWKHDAQHRQACSVMLLSLYDRLNGVERSWEGGGRPWARLHPSDYYWTLFEESDPRLEAWHKRYWIYDIDSPEDPLPEGVSIGDTVTEDNFEGTSGDDFDFYIATTVKKYWEDGTLGRTIEDPTGYRNIIQFRVSQAYLIAAEAYMKAGDNVTAQEYLDGLRAARNMTSIALTMDNILDEHARELGLEGHRYPMLKRLGLLYDRVNANPEWTGIIQSYHVRWPIPQSFIDEYGVIQNVGY
jgi:hypothetical protein